MTRTGRPPTHGLSNTPTYYSWKSMRERCANPKNKSFKYYGACGVEVCARWQSFVNFLEDVGERPSEQHVLSREEDKGDYEPGNCSWKLRSENEKERTPAKGEKQHLAKIKEDWVIDIRKLHQQGLSFTEIANKYSVHRCTISRIIKCKTWKHVNESD